MSRFLLLVLSLGVTVPLMSLTVCGEESTTAPIHASDRLFDQTNSVTLGLRTIKAEHGVLYRATEETYKFCHEQNIAVYRDTLYVMWSNGIQHESHNGQRILYSRSSDGLRWSEPAVLAEDHDGPGPLACLSAGFHADGDTLVAYYTAIAENRPGIDERNAVFYLTSKDGMTWSAPQKLAQNSLLEGPRKLSGGRLLMNGQWPSGQPRLRYSDLADGIGRWQDGDIPEVRELAPVTVAMPPPVVLLPMSLEALVTWPPPLTVSWPVPSSPTRSNELSHVEPVPETVPSEPSFTPTELEVLLCVEPSFTVKEPTELIPIKPFGTSTSPSDRIAAVVNRPALPNMAARIGTLRQNVRNKRISECRAL